MWLHYGDLTGTSFELGSSGLEPRIQVFTMGDFTQTTHLWVPHAKDRSCVLVWYSLTGIISVRLLRSHVRRGSVLKEGD